MSSTEDLVRNALADLAPVAPADSSAYAGVGRRITRRRRQRAATRLAAVAAVALVAVAGASFVGDRDDEPSGFQTGEGNTITTGPDAGQPDDGVPPGPGTGQDDDVDAADDGVSTGPTTRRLGTATFTLPAGWEVVQQDEVWIDAADPGGSETVPHPYTSMCLRRTADPGPLDCTLEMFHGEVPGHEGFQAYDPNGDWSWYRSTDVMACPDGADKGGEALDTVQPADGSTAPAESDFRAVGTRTAAYTRWSAVCETSGFRFSPEAWFLPESELLIIDVLGQPETEAILQSFGFGDEGG